MKVVLDTNVLVSAALRNRDPEAVILWVVSQLDCQWVVSPEILSEYREVLGRDRFGLTAEIRGQWFGLLDTLTTIVAVETPLDFPRDQKDAKFLGCAAACEADYFITGDRDFTEAQKLLTTTIISVSLSKRLV